MGVTVGKFNDLVEKSSTNSGTMIKDYVNKIMELGLPKPNLVSNTKAIWCINPSNVKDGYIEIEFSSDLKGPYVHINYSFASDKYQKIIGYEATGKVVGLSGGGILNLSANEPHSKSYINLIKHIAQYWGELSFVGNRPTKTDNRTWKERQVQFIKKVFLFSHFDSRGGSAIKIGGTKQEAIKDYMETLYAGMEEDEFINQIIEDDFVGEFSVCICDEKLEFVKGVDLLYDTGFASGFAGKTIVLWKIEDNGDVESNIPKGVKAEELGEDAFGLLVL